MDLPTVDGQGANEGDVNAVDLTEIGMGGDFFVAIDVVDGDLPALGKIRHIEEGADDLAVGQGDPKLVAALAVEGGHAEEFDRFALGQGVEQVAASGGVADEVEGFALRHGGGDGG